MNTNERIGIKGDVTIGLFSHEGELLSNFYHKNRVTQRGLELLMNRFRDCSGTYINSMGAGYDGTLPDGTEFNLRGPIAFAPISEDIQTLSPPIGGAIEYRATFDYFPENNVLREVGLYCDDVLFARSVFPPINITAGMYIDVNWVISFTSV